MDPRIGATYLITIWGGGANRPWVSRCLYSAFHKPQVTLSLFLSLCHPKTIASKLLLFFYLPLFNSVPPKILDEHLPLPPSNPPTLRLWVHVFRFDNSNLSHAWCTSRSSFSYLIKTQIITQFYALPYFQTVPFLGSNTV